MSELIDNRAHRVRTLRGIIQKLHAGDAPESVKESLKQIVQETNYSDIVAMEQELIAEGMPVEEITCMCDLHSQVTREVLVQIPSKGVPPGHPVDTFRRENDALRNVIARLRAALAPESESNEWRQAYNDLMDIEKHYQRKENALFPAMERHGITGPSKVMWAKHDEIRAMLKTLGAETSPRGSGVAEKAMAAIEEMFYKEESILLPMAMDALTSDDWGEVWASSPRYGWCLVEPAKGYKPPESKRTQAMQVPAGEAIQLPTGHLSLEQLTALFSALPVDITFVDADDRVAFFSEGPDRIFARSTAIIGRKVQHCHPPKSVHIVDQIVGDFRAARQNVAEFWIQLHGKFVHIRYFAVRDEKGAYLGTLEVTQDLTRLRALDGERRLLEYDPAPQTTIPGAPAWLVEANVRHVIDGDEMLSRGVHPVGLMKELAEQLKPGEIIRLDVGFRPTPLIDLMSRSGLTAHCVETALGRHTTYFYRSQTIENNSAAE
jgi:uncharacterized protein